MTPQYLDNGKCIPPNINILNRVPMTEIRNIFVGVFLIQTVKK